MFRKSEISEAQKSEAFLMFWFYTIKPKPGNLDFRDASCIFYVLVSEGKQRFFEAMLCFLNKKTKNKVKWRG